MKKKSLLFLLVFTIFLTACSQDIDLSQTVSQAYTSYENEDINIKIIDNIEEEGEVYKNILEDLNKLNKISPIEDLEIEISKRYIVPVLDKVIKADEKFIEREEFKKELIKKSYGIYDNWIVEGLYGYIFDPDREFVDFSTYYKDRNLSLFGARFYQPFSSEEEIENVKSASIDLVEYLLKNDKKKDLLENNIQISDIENWAKDKDLDLSYQEEIQSLMNRIEVIDKDKKNQLILNTKEAINGFTIDILSLGKVNEQYDTAEKIEQIILDFDRDILAIKEGMEKEAPNFYEDYKEVLNNPPKVEYIFDDNIKMGGLFRAGQNKIILNNISAQPHEYCHFLFHDSFVEKGIPIKKPHWLDEGIVEYLSLVYSKSHNEHIREVIKLHFNLTPEDIKNFEEKKIFKLYLKIFKKNNINAENVDKGIRDKNKKLMYYDILHLGQFKLAELEDKSLDHPGLLNEYYKSSPILNLMPEGNQIDYTINNLFMNYIIEEYGLEKILYLNVVDFSELTYEEVFGKSFEELQVDWKDYLKENIKDIELLL